jgi:predicted short-subunit dehydrogenase-like oxidoreductase (DUF2520 family)
MLTEPMAVFGLGRWGTTLARALIDAGLPLVAVSSHRLRVKQELPESLWPLWTGDTQRLVERARWIFLTVRDDAIEPTARRLATLRDDWTGYTFVHSSGAHGREPLATLHQRGARTGVFHPLNAFPDPLRHPTPVAGTPFGVLADEDLRSDLFALAEKLGGRPFSIPPNLRAAYHLVAVLVANAPLVLISLGRELLRRSGLEPDVRWEYYTVLLQSALSHAGDPEPILYLTGPWARRDRTTVRQHRDALQSLYPEAVPLYERLVALAQALYVAATGQPMGGEI